MTDIRERLGLDYIKKKSKPAKSGFEQRESDKFLQDAMLTIAPKVMKEIAKAPQKTTTVFDLVDQIREAVSTLGPVIDKLRDQGYVDIISMDLKGNHKVKLTDRGQRIAG